jgi:hypothetical protein
MIIMTNACCGAKHMKNNTEMNQQKTDLIPIFDISAKTKLLINDIKTELNASKIKLENYTPSKKIIDSYNLLYIDNQIHISGLMLTNINFNKAKLDEISVKNGSSSGKITTVQIPLNKFDQFLKINGIEYFEVSIKIKN